ncbi:hypothetical protein [Chitinophaga sp.]|uniref:hypothetical protein n=1 Tax=Chitinophaga sp. TaxID=1869181 RepID=UPI002F93DE42
MNKFIRSVLLFLLPVFVLGITGELLLRHIPNDYSYKNDYLEQHSNKVEVLFLGSSHAFFGMNPQFIHRKSFNAAYVSQSLDYDEAILEKYQWADLKYLVVPVSYFSLYTTLSTGIEAWRIRNYLIHYQLHTSVVPADYTEMLSSRLDVNFTRLKKYYKKHEPERGCDDLGWRIPYTHEEQPDLELSGAAAAKRHTFERTPATAKIFEENMASLRKIITFSKEHNVQLLLYTPPGYATYVRHMNRQQWANTQKVCEDAQKNNPGVFYVNFLQDTTFTAGDFYDADHVNHFGAEKLTKKIDQCIDALPGK